jgi:predicted enzyme related to lactoylglutathione lyase
MEAFGERADESSRRRGSIGAHVIRGASNPVVHLELHTGDVPGAREFYAGLLGWRAEQIQAAGGSYLALELGAAGFGGGIVECPTRHPLWLPYVEVGDIGEATRRARGLGASVLLEPREGPAGWRSVVAERAGAEIAFWQPKP